MWALLAASVVGAFYIPGNAPNAYDAGAPVPIQVNKMTSVKTQVPYSYYSLDYCQPEKLETGEENLGQILKGDLIQNTPYDVRMKVDDSCRVLCVKTFSEKSLNEFKGMIEDEYYVNLLADDLPAALVLHKIDLATGTEERLIVGGYPVGLKEDSDGRMTHAYLMNHLDMRVLYHPTPEGARVVGFEVEPRSIAHDLSQLKNETGMDCGSNLPRLDLVTLKPGSQVAFTYSVKFEYSEISWATRWDAHLRASEGANEVRWYAILNTFVFVLMLSAIAGTIMLRTLLRDIARYNNLDDIEEAQEESGWKLVHGDVFRRPNFSKLLASCVGTGVQVLIMVLLTLTFAMLGVLSPANRGALLQVALILFAFMGGPAGYVSARFNKLFQGDETYRSFIVTLWTAFQYTGVCFTTFLCLNAILWFKGSSGAIPFKYIFLLVVLWLGISVPLVFIGSYMGYRKTAITLPVRTNQIPRQIPKVPLALSAVMSVPAGGLFPFAAIFAELTFIMDSVWQHRFYYLFGFLTLTVIMLMIISAETSIIFTYFQLAAEDHQWWWRSYLTSAFSAVYFFLFCVFYFFDALEITRFVSVLLYFGYTALMAYTFFLVTGAIGFISTFWFVRAIYGAVKVD